MDSRVLPKVWDDLITASNYLPVIVKTIERFFDEKWSMEPNVHECFEMVYVKKGTGVFEVAGNKVSIGSNDILIIKPNEVHRLIVKSKGGCEFIVLSFKFEHLKNDGFSEISLENFLDFVKGNSSGSYIKLKVSEKNEIIILLNKILDEKNKTDIGNEFLDRLYVLELFVFISRALKMEWEYSIKGESGKIKELIDVSANYIKQNYDRHISIADVAKYVFLSQSYFTKVFKECTKMSPQGYLIKVRIDRAAELIEKTDKKICDIALDVGFANQQRFNEMFKKQLGMTPLQYRKTYKNKKH